MYKDFTDMPMWQLALEVGEIIFIQTNDLPKKEDYGLTSQIRRASVSISANIAEAFGRTTAPEKISFMIMREGLPSKLKVYYCMEIKLGILVMKQRYSS